LTFLNLNVIQMIRTYLFAAVAAITLSSCGGNKVTVNDKTITLEDGIYAKLETTMGDILIDFHEDLVPMTAANFIALAEGNHPEVAEKYEGKPYYNGTLFHRVIKNFMIQGGDPDGTGSGGPGYAFPQEINEELRHDKAGVVSMANAGPGTNGSQFFITHNPTPHLDGGYNIFAQVLSGQDVVAAMGEVETMAADRPVEKLVLQNVQIIRVGSLAKNWDAPAAFTAGKSAVADAKAAAAAVIENEIDAAYPEATKSETGLRYIIETFGDGPKPEIGQMVRVHYAGYLMDGTLFDSSIKSVAQANGKYDERREPYEPFALQYGPMARVIEGWKEGIQLLNVGGKAKLIIPPYLGYGARGAGGAIPPNSSLVFDVEVVSIEK
jgi:peptidylprolyl isomerase